MRTRPFGPTGSSVAIVGEGTWNMERDPRSSAVASIRRALELGMNHVDTAELYGDGKVERIVDEAIEGRRDEVFLVSKVLPQHGSRAATIAACEASLERLGTEYLDCYLLHWPGAYPLEETIAAFQELVRTGKIRSFGVSNFDEEELEHAVRLAGPGRIACNQLLYHLGERGIEHAVLPACERHGVAVVAYSPLGSGDFPDPASRGGRVLASIARAHGASPAQVALAFLLRERSVLVIPKAAKLAHVVDNAAAAALDLTADEIDRIAAAFPLGRRRSGVPML